MKPPGAPAAPVRSPAQRLGSETIPPDFSTGLSVSILWTWVAPAGPDKEAPVDLFFVVMAVASLLGAVAAVVITVKLVLWPELHRASTATDPCREFALNR